MLELILPHGPADGRPSTPALAAMLARGEWRGGLPADPGQRLLTLCGFVPTDGGPPLASLCCLADGGDPGDAYWLRADPVHLSADQDALYLAADAQALAVTADEAAALAAEFNALYRADGRQLLPLAPTRWYLRCADSPRITTTPPQAALSHAVRPLLPQGPDAMQWHALLNEVQMLFHHSPVNAARAAQGQPPINSLWPWGGGRLPHRCTVPWRRIYANDCVAGGLAVLAQRQRVALPAAADAVLGGDGPALVVFDAQPPDWGEMERHWFAPLREALRNGRLEALVLHLCGSGESVRVDRAALRRWWRGRFGAGTRS